MDHTSSPPERVYPTRRSLREAAARAAAEANRDEAASANETAASPKPEPQPVVEQLDPIITLGSVIPSPVSLGSADSPNPQPVTSKRATGRRVLGGVAAAASACGLFTVMMVPTLAPAEEGGLAAVAEAQSFTSESVSTSIEAGSLAQLEAPEVELLDARAASTLSGDDDAIMQYPLSGSVTLTDGFGPRSFPVSGFHGGQDFATAAGTPVGAAAAGTIISSGFVNGRCGFGAKIEHEIDGQEVTTLYCHMEAGSPTHAVGDVVAKGDQVGRVGNTGLSFGAHLHFEIEVAGQGVDPMPFLEKYTQIASTDADDEPTPAVPASEDAGN